MYQRVLPKRCDFSLTQLFLACAPIRNIVRSVALGVPLVTIVYILMNVAYMTVLNVNEMVNAPAVAVVSYFLFP